MTLAAPRHLFPRGEDFLLLPPTRQPHAYANVDRMFATRAIRRGDHVLPLPYGPELTPATSPPMSNAPISPGCWCCTAARSGWSAMPSA
ncbi:hypothetical protein ACFQY5_32265 [Paeniroseomonas aquatica]|uniref:hypothetical protein n=1 Tax=Paeniroseomonas aquatica TaxID=373043 RepID=UPI00360C8AB0